MTAMSSQIALQASADKTPIVSEDNGVSSHNQDPTAQYGNIPAAEWFASKDMSAWDRTLSKTTRYEGIPAFEWLADKGANMWITALIQVAKSDNIAALKLLAEYGTYNCDWDTIMQYTAIYSKDATLEWLTKHVTK